MTEFVTQEVFNAAMEDMRIQFRNQQSVIQQLSENNQRLLGVVDQLVSSNNGMSRFLKNMLSDDKIILPFVARGLELLNNPTPEVADMLKAQMVKPNNVHFSIPEVPDVTTLRVTYHLPEEANGEQRLLILEQMNAEGEWAEHIPEEKMLGAWIIDYISVSETLKPGVPFYLDVMYSLHEDIPLVGDDELAAEEDIGDVDDKIVSRGYEAEAIGDAVVDGSDVEEPEAMPAIADEDLMAAAQAFDETQNAGEGQVFEVDAAADIRDPGVDKEVLS